MQLRPNFAFGMVLALLTLGCAARAHNESTVRPASSVSELDVVYRPRLAASVERGHRGPAEDAARALGFPLIEDAVLPEGARELRVSDQYAMIAGTPVPVLRLIERAGRPAVGQLLIVWQEHRLWPRRYRATRCTPWADSVRSCAFVSPAKPEWTAVAARLEALGAWTMAARCEDQAVVTDSGELRIDRLTGVNAGVYECNAPQRRQSSTAGRAALALYEYFLSVANLAGDPPPA